MRRAKRVISAILCVCLAAGLAPTGRAVWGSWSWGSLGAVEESTVAPGTIYREISAETSAGPQRMHTVEFDPKSETVQLRAGKSRGNVYGVQTVLGITNEMEKDFPGQVVAGVNGDFFDLGVGVPFGVFMDDGKILSTPPQYSSSFGIKNDGTPFVLTHGTILNKILVIDEKKIEMSGVNNRIKDADSLMMYTVDYGASTRVKAESLEVVCEVLSGEPRHGDTMQLRVAEIHSDVGNTAISEGYIVLSATGARREEIAALQVGQEISAFFQFAQFWQDVKFAVGGNYTVLKDGEIQDVSDGARNPRTLVGYKEDGTVVLCTVDGRQKNYSAGATLKQAATVLKDMGCAAALNLDGGGSTTFVLRPAGSMTRRVMNSPSEGSQRQVANALVLINTAEKQTAPTALFVSPNGQKILAGGTYTYTVAGAMDENYQPHEVNGPISWQASGEVGSIDENGVFTAASAGSAQISAEYLGASGSASAEVVDTLNAIEAEYDRLTLEPEEEKEISVTARHDGAKVAHSAGQLTWAVDEAVGTVVSPGVIKAGKKYAEGKIYVSYKGTVLEIPVTVNGEKEIEFSDMEAHAWAKDAVYRLAKLGIIRGVTADTFAPQNSIKRADFMLLLVRMMGVDTSEKPAENFADVPEGAYYYNELGHAKALGIANGVSATEFAPERNITREEMFTLVWRVMSKNSLIETEADLTTADMYADSTMISGYARQAIATMSSMMLVQGDSASCVNPKKPATRAESAVFIDRVNALVNPQPEQAEEITGGAAEGSAAEEPQEEVSEGEEANS